MLDYVVFRSVDDGYIVGEQADAAGGGKHRNVADCAGGEVVDHILLGEGVAGFVDLDVVVGVDALEFGGVGGD